MKTKIIYSSILPFKGFKAINLFGIIFARKECAPLTPRIVHHERIHTRQMLEMLILFFYIWYVSEWLVRLIRYGDAMKAYRNISFEREAHANDADFSFLQHREPYHFLHYL